MNIRHPPYRAATLALVAMLTLALSGCATPQFQATTLTSQRPSALPDLQQHGLAFITSSSVTGQEEDKPAMALIFADVMQRMRPGMRVVAQAETLSAINRAGLAGDYRKTIEEYGVTGILNHGTLQQIARVAGARYVAQLKLSSFRQEAKSRFSALGLRIVETQVTVLRLFVQIWDSQDGAIVWEGGTELASALDSTSETTIAFKTAIEQAAQSLVARMPGTPKPAPAAPPAPTPAAAFRADA